MNEPIQESTLQEWLDGLRRFGADGRGVTRLAYGKAWCEAQRWLAGRAEGLGLACSVDAGGNLFAHAPGLSPHSRAIFIGSHLDTVRQGGAYDGGYGSVAGILLAAMCLGSNGTPVVAYVSAEEEGSRFSAPFLGARSMLDLARSEDLDSIRDGDGVSWRTALDFARERCCSAPVSAGPRPFEPLFQPVMELELHIEQGPVLEAENRELGVVTAIIGFQRVEVRIVGEARHAGTTPMSMRRDALVAAAECIWSAEVLAVEHGDPAVATVGRAEAAPGAFNVVPGECELRLDVRHGDPAILAIMLAELEKRFRAIAERREVKLDWKAVSAHAPALMAPEMIAEAVALAGEMVFSFKTMVSGAGHDSMIFAGAGVPSMMVFVPSRKGISHHPDEFTSASELWEGVRFSRALLERLSRREALDISK